MAWDWGEDSTPCCTSEFWTFLSICIVLVSFAGITSGLALGLLSFGKVDLEVLIKAGRPHESKYAAKILSLVKNEHLLLCTLLVAKSLAMEALPILLDTILPFWVAILVSVSIAIAFAEVIPQAVCSRYGLLLGARSAFFVRLLLLVFFPVAYPISKLLDWLLGREHSALYRRAELKTLVDLHANEAGKGGELTQYEATIIAGALELTEKTAKDAMTPISQTFSLDINSKLDMPTMGLIVSKGHSRVPIYSGDPKNIVGLILAKNLIFRRPEEETPIKSMTIRKIPRVYEDWPLYEILDLFQEGHSHMAIVLKGNESAGDNTTKISLSKLAALSMSRSFGSRSVVPEIGEGTDPPSTESTKPNEFTMHTSPLYHSVDIRDVEGRNQDTNRRSKRRELGSGTISSEDLESFRSFSDEEVIGIITMEDVMEELLQKEILDETDQYVDLHKSIQINLPPSTLSSSSSARFSMSRLQRKTQEPSSLRPHVPPPLAKPTGPTLPTPATNILNNASVSLAVPTLRFLLSHSRKVSRMSGENFDPEDVQSSSQP